MFELLKSLKKAGLNAENKLFSFGHYYDGLDHDFSYPCAVVTIQRDLSGSDTAAALDKLHKIAKKHDYSVYDKRITCNGWFMILIRNDNIEQGRKEYGECVAFQYGFWMKRHEKPDASDKELIAAGHAAMQEKGYSIRVA